MAWTYFGGVALLAGELGMLFPPTTRLAATCSGLMVFTRFLILHIPRAVGDLATGNEWIAVFEALAISGLAFIVAGTAGSRSPR